MILFHQYIVHIEPNINANLLFKHLIRPAVVNLLIALPIPLSYARLLIC